MQPAFLAPNPAYQVPTWAKVLLVASIAGGAFALYAVPPWMQNRRREKHTERCGMKWFEMRTGELEPFYAESAAAWMQARMQEDPDVSAARLGLDGVDYLRQTHGLCDPGAHQSYLILDVEAKLRELARELGAR